MAHFALLWKARTIERCRLKYEQEKLNSIMLSKEGAPNKSLLQKFRHYRYNTKKRLCKRLQKWFPEGSAVSNLLIYLRTDQTFPNFVLKSIVGFVSGIIMTYLCFMFFVFQLSISLVHATIMSSIIGVLLTLGLAFSYRVRCLVFLLIPQFFSRVGRYTLTCYALVLILTGPATNTLKNSEVLSESMACSQEQVKNSVSQITMSIKKPFNSMKDTIKLMIDKVKQVAVNFKESLIKVHRLVLSIVHVLQSTFSWLSSIVGMCNKKVGRPYARCTNALGESISDCQANYGPYFGHLCNIAYVAHVACCAIKPLDYMCVLLEYVSGTILATINRKLRTFNDNIKTMLYVSVHIHHSYSFSSSSSKSASQVAAGIVTEIRRRAEPLLTWLSWSSCVTSLFLLLIIFRAKYYQHMYETRSRFDNRYVTKELRDLDLKRVKENRDTVLPLNRRERVKYVTTTSFRLVASEKRFLTRSIVFMGITTFKLLIHMAADYSLYWVLMTIRYHGRFQAPQLPGPPDAGVQVSGDGPVAGMFKSIIESLTIPLASPAPAPATCLPDPYPPDMQRYTQIGVLIFLLWFFALFEPYGLRLRHVIMGHYRPERAKARAVWLYNHILRTRGGFLKLARRKLHRNYKYSTERCFTFKQWLDAHIPCHWLRYLLGTLPKEPHCLLCGTIEHGCDLDTTLVFCETQHCPGVYCVSCFNDIGQVCTICLSPADYGDYSDVSLEKGSSEDSSYDEDSDSDASKFSETKHTQFYPPNRPTDCTDYEKPPTKSFKKQTNSKNVIFKKNSKDDQCDTELLINVSYEPQYDNNVNEILTDKYSYGDCLIRETVFRNNNFQISPSTPLQTKYGASIGLASNTNEKWTQRKYFSKENTKYDQGDTALLVDNEWQCENDMNILNYNFTRPCDYLKHYTNSRNNIHKSPCIPALPVTVKYDESERYKNKKRTIKKQLSNLNVEDDIESIDDKCENDIKTTNDNGAQHHDHLNHNRCSLGDNIQKSTHTHLTAVVNNYNASEQPINIADLFLQCTRDVTKTISTNGYKVLKTQNKLYKINKINKSIHNTRKFKKKRTEIVYIATKLNQDDNPISEHLGEQGIEIKDARIGKINKDIFKQCFKRIITKIKTPTVKRAFRNTENIISFRQNLSHIKINDIEKQFVRTPSNNHDQVDKRNGPDYDWIKEHYEKEIGLFDDKKDYDLQMADTKKKLEKMSDKKKIKITAYKDKHYNIDIKMLKWRDTEKPKICACPSSGCTCKGLYDKNEQEEQTEVIYRNIDPIEVLPKKKGNESKLVHKILRTIGREKDRNVPPPAGTLVSHLESVLNKVLEDYKSNAETMQFPEECLSKCLKSYRKHKRYQIHTRSTLNDAKLNAEVRSSFIKKKQSNPIDEAKLNAEVRRSFITKKQSNPIDGAKLNAEVRSFIMKKQSKPVDEASFQDLITNETLSDGQSPTHPTQTFVCGDGDVNEKSQINCKIKKNALCSASFKGKSSEQQCTTCQKIQSKSIFSIRSIKGILMTIKDFFVKIFLSFLSEDTEVETEEEEISGSCQSNSSSMCSNQSRDSSRSKSNEQSGASCSRHSCTSVNVLSHECKITPESVKGNRISKRLRWQVMKIPTLTHNNANTSNAVKVNRNANCEVHYVSELKSRQNKKQIHIVEKKQDSTDRSININRTISQDWWSPMVDRKTSDVEIKENDIRISEKNKVNSVKLKRRQKK